jgi:probable F420-dependent oxidoreductase
MTPRLGLNLPYVEGSMDGSTPRWADILAMAETAEAIGFDAVWISDHVGFGDPDGQWSGAWDSWTLLSALAAATTRVRLGTYVSAMPYRNPALLAKMAETLDEISGGRVILGLGAGWNEPEFRAYGFPFERRFDRFEDGLRIISSMLKTGRADHDGRVQSAHGARIEPRGPRPNGLPIMVGTTGPRLLRLTAELADEWNSGMRAPEDLPPILAKVDAACAAVDRDPRTLVRSAETLVKTGDAFDPVAVAAQLGRYADLGIDHIQVQLRPNSVTGVRAFEPVFEALVSR